jgi:broad specificity phosphatase PhoE
MLVLLVRHGHAGTKRQWRGDDGFRPLDAEGYAQAMALRRVLVPFQPARIVSSPYLRCIESITPLAETLGATIERTQDLVPDAGAAATTLARTIGVEGPGSIVLCTHGEVIGDMQALMASEGDAPSGFGPDSLREKGSVWVLERQDGQFVRADYLPPPRAA